MCSSHTGTESIGIVPCRSYHWKPQQSILRWSINHNQETQPHELALLPSALLAGCAQRSPLHVGRCHTIRYHFVIVSSGEMSFRVLSAPADTQSTQACCVTDGGGRVQNQAFHPSVVWSLQTQVEICIQRFSRNVSFLPCSMPNRVHL